MDNDQGNQEQANEDSKQSNKQLNNTDKDARVDETEETSPTTSQPVRFRYKKHQKNYFFIGGGNGGHLVENYLTSELGWERIHDRAREDYKLKWCEIKSHNNYHCFREGEQLCYQIPNNKLLTTKIGLLTSLQEYDRVMNKVKKGRPRIMRYQDFLPETYRLDIKDDREAFFDIYKDGEVWISKPTGLNQGKGIYLIRSNEDITRIQDKITETEDDIQAARKLPFKAPMARIVQRYVKKPLLLDGKKFDVRNYMLIACTNPLVVFYRDGYCRLTCMPYDFNSTDLTGHLTNQFMQKKNPLYEEVKDDTVWSMDRFNDYVNENYMEKKNLPADWVHTVLKRRCQQIQLQCFQAVRHKLECRLGFFDLYGCDFMVDDEFKISLLEMNCNPALHTNCETLREIMPDLVEETLKLSMEIFEKANKRERILPLASQENFLLLYNGDVIEAAERRERLQSAAEARKRARSAQRRKRFVPGQYVYRRSVTTASNNSTVNTTVNTANTPLTNNTTTAHHTNSNSTNHSSNANSHSSSANSSNPVPTASTCSLTVTTTNVTVMSHSPYRVSIMPSTQVTAPTSSSQMRVVQHSKSTPNVNRKPFYAGGSVASRPYSAPRFNRGRYSMVEPRVVTHNHTIAMESPRRNCINNAALAAAANSKVVNYAQRARNVLLAPNRFEVLPDPQFDEDSGQPDDLDYLDEIGDYDSDALERANFFEQILEEAEEAEDDDVDLDDDIDNGDDEEEELMAIAGCDTPDAVRRPSAKLPPSYHSSSLDHTLPNGTSLTWPRYPQPRKPLSVQRKISRIASLSVKGNFSLEFPLPSVGAPYSSPRPTIDAALKQPQQSPFRGTTNGRLRHSLQATTCTLEIGPKSRRGLVAVTTAGKGPVLQTDKANNSSKRGTTKLKFINGTESVAEAAIPSTLLYLAATHLQNGTSDVDNYQHQQHAHGSLVVPSNSQTKDALRQTKNLTHNLKLTKHLADSSTQTAAGARQKVPHSGEEKVIWRLRSRAAEGGRTTTDGSVSPPVISASKGQKVALKVPVVTQSPGLISPRKLVEFSPRHPPSQKKAGTAYTPASYKAPRDVKDSLLSQRDSDDATNYAMSMSHQSTALSKVVAVATAAPKRQHNAHANEGAFKQIESANDGSELDEVTLLAPG